MEIKSYLRTQRYEYLEALPSPIESGSLSPMYPVFNLSSNQTHLLTGPLFPYPIRVSSHKVWVCVLPAWPAILLPYSLNLNLSIPPLSQSDTLIPVWDVLTFSCGSWVLRTVPFHAKEGGCSSQPNLLMICFKKWQLYWDITHRLLNSPFKNMLVRV